MKHIKAREESRGVHHSLEGQRGQGIAEYGIILILVSVALVVVINLMGPAIEDIFEEVANDGPMAPPSLMGYTPPPSPTVSPTSTFGPSPTATATATATGTPTNTPTPLPPTVTNTPTPTRTPIPSPTNTPLPATHTATATRTPTPSPTATSTSTLTPTPTRTPVVLPSNTPVLPTNTPTLTPSPTPTPSGPWTYVHAMQGDASVVRACRFFWCPDIGIDAEVRIRIRRSNNNSNVSNAIAYGTWNDGQNDNCASSTDNNGWCTIARRILWVDEATFTVTNVTHSSLQYNGLLNNRSSITVSP